MVDTRKMMRLTPGLIVEAGLGWRGRVEAGDRSDSARLVVECRYVISSGSAWVKVAVLFGVLGEEWDVLSWTRAAVERFRDRIVSGEGATYIADAIASLNDQGATDGWPT